ncbi:thioredoxin domain-containing protein [Inmirania thermothiophila]|uniref:Spermatogenesis-associated protein 20-like TRX domain-containing protein n=1 Tax=Inmirania thermothiophila TaxID=1750597 RepID=A0A3N1Y760_9GAMM|nr:thioredoxin domain-containing protein [Inmirania thermothiophila]ROR34653.1 hypothetical protein EDC57_0554 [Inmirania thermothiophila]
MPRNRLADEASPYLLQHADNPVDWYPWGEEALARARREDRPILLSIGYSACHWCHVMAHESFEDEATARLMNTHFVNVKVDREERPDLDRVYQIAHQILARRPGGWPLTVFLDPQDLAPIFAGTYFPPEPRHGMPSFREVLEAVARFWREHRDEARRQGAELGRILAGVRPRPGALPDPAAAFAAAVAELAAQHDARHGGFGGAPKFPQPTLLVLLARAEKPRGRAMLAAALAAMARGGLRDHLGGGFFRYCVDADWTVPHFEKMLYDNALLLPIYAEAAARDGEAEAAEVAEATAAWALTTMQSPEGPFWSSLDADSAGGEGAFYLWTRDEARSVVGEADWPLVSAHFGLEGPPNFEGRWHLTARTPLAQTAARLGIDPAAAAAALARARARLLAARAARPAPGRDEKWLAAWNGLMIGGVARAGRLLGREDWIDAALRAAAGTRAALWRDGTLHASGRSGRLGAPGFLDDYAFLGLGLVELVQARFDAGLLAWARTLAETMRTRFADPAGGFHLTAEEHDRLPLRLKPTADEAVPSGNGAAARLLAALGLILGEGALLDAARRTVAAAAGDIERAPSAHATLLLALDEIEHPPATVVVRAADAGPWREVLRRHPDPRRLELVLPAADAGLPPPLAAYRARGDAAWVCRGTACSAPLASPEALAASLASPASSA